MILMNKTASICEIIITHHRVSHPEIGIPVGCGLEETSATPDADNLFSSTKLSLRRRQNRSRRPVGEAASRPPTDEFDRKF